MSLQYNHDKPMATTTGPHSRIVEERRALLQRVLWSRQFEKSNRIRDFLVYVCDRTFEDPEVEIHEQEIGNRVFGRDVSYDTGDDNIVRVTASQARKKLSQYFGAEGASEPFVLEIPKGQYTPLFREREAAPVEIASALERSPTPAKSGRAVVVLAICSIVLALIAGWLAMRLRSERVAARTELEANPALSALWSLLLPAGGRTDIVTADSSLSLFQELLDHQLTLADYLKPDLWTQAAGLSKNPELQAFAQRAAQRRFTSLASVTTGYRIAQLAGRDQSRIAILSARDFNIRQMKSDNVVLLGSTRANPWVELIEDRLNFHFAFDQKSRFAYFENKQPRAGEPKAYTTGPGISYCQIAFLPNLGKTGNVLAISGTETEGTEGGGEFITTERSLVQLQSLVAPDRAGRFPYFEVLLKSTRVGGATPGFSIVAARAPL